jgi:hypothetical protein
VTRFQKGLLLALLQLAIVLSIAGKYYSDRTRLPRVWVRTMPFDPNLPIRGRYVRFQVPVETRAAPAGSFWQAQLAIEDGELVASPATTPGAVWIQRMGKDTVVLQEPLAYFIPEHVPDPSRRPPREELWVEVSVPAKGPPRPIRLGLKKDGVLTPLDLN